MASSTACLYIYIYIYGLVVPITWKSRWIVHLPMLCVSLYVMWFSLWSVFLSMAYVSLYLSIYIYIYIYKKFFIDIATPKAIATDNGRATQARCSSPPYVSYKPSINPITLKHGEPLHRVSLLVHQSIACRVYLYGLRISMTFFIYGLCICMLYECQWIVYLAMFWVSLYIYFMTS